MMVWRRIGWGIVCLCASLFVQSLFHQDAGLTITGALLALAAITALRPFYGLLFLASFSPLANILFLLGSGSRASVEFPEAMILAFIAGWAARRIFAPAPLAVSPGTRWAAMLLLVAAAASGAAHWPLVRAEALDQPTADLVRSFLTRDYLLHPQGSAPITAAALVCEGMLLLLIVADVCAANETARDAILRAMVLGAAAAGSLNVLRIVSVSIAQDNAWHALLAMFRTVRVNVQYSDLNAAGSYFALMLPIAIGLVPRRPMFVAVCLPPIIAALWISGSRFALAGTCVGIGIAALLALRGRRRRSAPVLAGLVLVAVVAGALWKVYPEGRNTGPKRALAIRMVLASAGLDMAARHLVFGVGLGRFYAASEPYLRATPAIGQRENAHNYFIQILAELGVPGLLIFLGVLIVPLQLLWSGATPLPAASVGLFGGILAFLLSCFGGHPLIVPEASYPFWVALGLAAASGAASGRATPRAMRIAGVVVVLLFIVTLPHNAAQATRGADMSGISIGLSKWQHDPEGLRYRWAGGRATFFVESDGKALRLPLRNVYAGDLEVHVLLNGREADRILLPTDGRWHLEFLILPPSATAFSRIDLLTCPPGSSVPVDVMASDDGGAIEVGRPTLQE